MRQRMVLFVALLAVVTTSVACGSSGKKSSNAASGKAAASKAPSGDPIVIGEVTSDTGPVGNPGAGDGLAAWAAYVNAHGGLLGRPVKVDRCDDQGVIEKYADCARGMASNTAVIAMGSGTGRYEGKTGAPIYQAAGLALVCANPGNNDELNASNTFCITGGFATGFNSEFAYMKSKSITKVKFGTADSAGGHSSVDLLKKIATPHGVNVEGLFASTTSPDYLPLATAAVSSDAGAVVAAFAASQTLQMLQALQQVGNKKPIFSGEATVSPAVVADPSAEGLLVGTAFPSTDTDSAEMKLFKGAMTDSGKSASIGTNSLAGWLSGRVIENVVQSVGAGALSRQAVTNYLMTQTVKGVPLLPDMALSKAPKSIPGLAAVANPTSSMYQVKGGKYVAVPNSEASLP